MEHGTLLIIGVSSDIGMAYAEEYAGRYERIVGTYRTDSDALRELRGKLGEKLELYKLDLLNEEETERFCTHMTEHSLLPDYVLHLSAQKTPMVRANELESERLRADLEISVVSFLRILRPVLSSMSKKQFGRICCMLSSVTRYPNAFQTSYMASKFALYGAVRGLAAEYAGKKITVNAVSPSMIDTKFNADISDFVRKKNIQINPQRRLANPGDVTRAIAFLMDDANEYITGENVLISGGGHFVRGGIVLEKLHS